MYSQARSVRVVSKFARRCVAIIRDAKYSKRNTAEQIQQSIFPQVHPDIIADICLYRIWRTLDLQGGEPSIIADAFSVGVDSLLEFVVSAGLELTKREVDSVREWAKGNGK